MGQYVNCNMIFVYVICEELVFIDLLEAWRVIFSRSFYTKQDLPDVFEEPIDRFVLCTLVLQSYKF